MAERLRRSGIRPVSLLVDVTQYVMLELGQPMQAFDRDLLHGPVGVRHAREGEALAQLDGRAAAVDPGFLEIGRASFRERSCQYVWISVVPIALTQNTILVCSTYVPRAP